MVSVHNKVNCRFNNKHNKIVKLHFLKILLINNLTSFNFKNKKFSIILIIIIILLTIAAVNRS